MNAITRQIIMTSIVSALRIVKTVIKEQDWAEVLDYNLNKVESYFEEGTLLDDGAEALCAEVRDIFQVEDSNPDN